MRPIVSAAALALLIAFTLPATAANDEPAPDMARAAQSRQDATRIREAAEARFGEDEPACYKRFLVNRCLDQAKERRVLEIRRARQMDVEAGHIELADKNRRYAERKAAQAAEAPQKAVERAQADARNRAENEARLRKLSEKDGERIRQEQEAKTRGVLEAEARHRKEAAEAQRRAEEAQAAADRADKARTDKAAYDERAVKNAEKKAEKAKKAAEQQPAK